MEAVFQLIISLMVEHGKSKSKERYEQPQHYYISGLQESQLKILLGQAYPILNDNVYMKDKGKGKSPNNSVCQLALTIEEAETFVDGKDYILNSPNNPSTIDKRPYVSNFISNFKDLIDRLSNPPITSQPSGQTSRNDKGKGKSIAMPSSGGCADGENIDAPGQPVWKFVLFLLTFPKGYVFNWNRITRLAAAYGVTPGIRVEELLQYSLIEVVDRYFWEPNAVTLHFQIGNNVEELSSRWPKNREILSSLVSPSRSTPDALPLEKKIFHLLKILIIRIIRLKDATPLKTLLLLRYLDLKHTRVEDCREWLESLKKLEVLDLRYTGVREIYPKYLEHLKKLKHLLLGHTPGEADTPMLLPQVLWGPKLNIEERDRNLPGLGLPSNLETLRAIRRPDYIGTNVFPETVVDLYVTGLGNEKLERFWRAVENCKKLTSLGVATTEPSENKSRKILCNCPSTLMKQLTRLRVEGQFTECCDLKRFVKLIDLTLISAKLDINKIPELQELACLRLYRAGAKALRVQHDKFTKLKKLVIGDMKELKKVTVGCKVVTLKLCNLPKLDELTCSETIPHLLLKRNNDKGTVPSGRCSSLEKCIFLKGIGISEDDVRFHKSPHVKMYRYDKNKRSYELK